jgi:ribosomal protein S18 acetylase RimI-like enzyme
MASDDIDVVVELWDQHSREARHHTLTQAERAGIGSHLRHSLEHPRVVTLVGCDGAALVAFLTAHVHVHPTMDRATGEIDELYVQPSRRVRGLGRALIEEACADLRRRGVGAIHGVVDAANSGGKSFTLRLGGRLAGGRYELPG